MTKAWSKEWDDLFLQKEWGKYPAEDLVAFIARNFGSAPDRGCIRLLELGCGPGANVWYAAREGYDVSGIDGSGIAIERARVRLAADGLRADLRVGDLVSLPFADRSFHGAFDVAAIQHNRLADASTILREAHRVLEPGGKLFSSLLAEGTWGEGLGTMLEAGTWRDVTEGPAARCGIVHFYRESEIPAVFAAFSDVRYERKERTLADRTRKFCQWTVCAVK